MADPSPARSPRRRRTTTALLTAGTALAAAALALVPAGGAAASSHREAPLIAKTPDLDNTDVYAFVSPDKADTVTLVSNWFGLQEPNGGPTFYPWAVDAHHDINIDSNGDGKPDITYRWDFRTDDKRIAANTFLYNTGPVTSIDDPDLLFRQYYTLTKIDWSGEKPKETVVLKDAPVAPSNTGPAGFPDYGKVRNGAIVPVGKGQSFVGQAEDPFFLDLRVFDLLYGGNLSEVGKDTLAGYNVNSIALQVPKADVALKGDPTRNPVVGIWSTTSKKSVSVSVPGKPGVQINAGPYVQVSRLGNPLVNEVVLPVGLKDTFNGLTPDKDATIPAVVARVTDPELPKLIQSIYGIPAPKTPRNDLVEIFLTGIAKNAPTLDGTAPPIQADLNSQVLNKDAGTFQPSEMLRLNLNVPPSAQPNRLGVLAGDLQGFPNGRRLADDITDISIQAVEGATVSGIVPALATGDKVNANDKPFGSTFPYVALPNNKNVNDKANSQGAGAAVPPGSTPGVGPSLPTGSLITGLVAALLLGAGGLLLRRGRREAAGSAGA